MSAAKRSLLDWLLQERSFGVVKMRGCLDAGGSTTQQPLRVLLPTAPPKRKRRLVQKRTTNVAALVFIGMTLCLLSSCRMALTVVTQGGEQQLREAVPQPPLDHESSSSLLTVPAITSSCGPSVPVRLLIYRRYWGLSSRMDDLPMATGYLTPSAFCLRPRWLPGPRSSPGNLQLRPASPAMSGSSVNSGSSLRQGRCPSLIRTIIAKC